MNCPAFRYPRLDLIEPNSNEGQPIAWVTIEEVENLIKEEPRKVFVDVYTTWCGPCKLMDRTTFKDEKVTDYIEANYYAVKLNADSPHLIKFKGKQVSEKDLAKSFQVQGYPTIILMDDQAKVFPINEMDDGVTVIEDRFKDVGLVVVGSRTKNFIVAFKVPTGGASGLEFNAVQDQLPVVMEDDEGNRWSVFGEAVSGPRAGQHLECPQSLIGYWFTFGSFYPTPEIYGEDPN